MRNRVNLHSVIMVLENGYPMSKGGGAEKQVNTIGQEIKEHDWDVKILCPMVSYASQVPEELVNGISVHRIKYPKIRILGGIFMLISLAMYLIKHRSSYEVIHVHIASNMAAVCSLIGKILNKPVLIKLTGWTEIQNGILDEKVTPRIFLLKWAIRKATHYQATSQQIASLLVERGFDNKKINLIPNAVDTDRFNLPEKCTAPSNVEADKIGIFVGRLVKEKNLELFFDCFSKVFSDQDSVSLIIVGDGYLKEELEAYVDELGISAKVHFLGPKSDVEKYISMADFGILPSLYEGLSNTLLEYMASGIPVLGSKVSGTEDIIKDGKNGWLFNSENRTELISCLTELKNTDTKKLSKMGLNGRDYIVEYAGIRSVTNKIMKLYL